MTKFGIIAIGGALVPPRPPLCMPMFQLNSYLTILVISQTVMFFTRLLYNDIY